MQQVGQKRHSQMPVRVLAADPHQMPMLRVSRPRRHPALVGIGRGWVLHKGLLVRLVVACVVAVVLAGAFQSRGGIMKAVSALALNISSGLASAGFGIATIEMTGQAVSSEADLARALDISKTTSILSYDAEAARQRLLALPTLADASVRKIYPDRLKITLTEKTPLARWTVDGTTYLIDGKGEKLGAVTANSNTDLPLIVGVGAADNALSMIKELNLYAPLERGLLALSRIGDRRWDLIYDTGLRVELPETGVVQALKHLSTLQTDHAIMDRDLSLIDLRVAGSVAVRLATHNSTGTTN